MNTLEHLICIFWPKYEKKVEYKKYKVGLVCYIKLLEEFGLHSKQEVSYYSYLVKKNRDYRPWLNRARKSYLEDRA